MQLYRQGNENQPNSSRKHILLNPPPTPTTHHIIHILLRSRSAPRCRNLVPILHSLQIIRVPSYLHHHMKKERTLFKNSLLLPTSRSSSPSIPVCACTSASIASTCDFVNSGGGSENVTVPSAEMHALMSPDSICVRRDRVFQWGGSLDAKS
jgi:hypothetical protein